MKISILTLATICLLLSCSNESKIKPSDAPEVKVLDSATIAQNKLDSVARHERKVREQIQDRKNRKRKADEAKIRRQAELLHRALQ